MTDYEAFQLELSLHIKTWRQLEHVTGLLREIRHHNSSGLTKDMQNRIDAALSQQEDSKAMHEPAPAQDEQEWTYCPECGSGETHHQEGTHKQCANCYQEWFSDIDYTGVVRGHLATHPAQTEQQPELTVWEGPMPESNGKSNFTAVLMRKGSDLFDGISGGMTIARSEYPDRVRYEADCVRWLIGEIEEEPCITDYDSDKHSGYATPIAQSCHGYEGGE